MPASFDHLVGAGEDGRGQRCAKVASNSHVDGQLEAGRPFYRRDRRAWCRRWSQPGRQPGGENDAVLDDSLLAQALRLIGVDPAQGLKQYVGVLAQQRRTADRDG